MSFLFCLSSILTRPRFVINPLVSRIVVDEAHNTYTTESYRPAMLALRQLKRAVVTRVFLTATLLPGHESALAHSVGIPPTGKTLILRSPTARANHSIQVATVDPSSRDAFDVTMQLATLLLESWEEDPSARGIIFIRARRDVDPFKSTAKFPVCTYHGHMHDEEREEQLRTWLSDSRTSGPKWIVATTALLHGVDYPTVNCVIFLGVPYGLYDFVQGSGRAGRSGQKALIAIVHSSVGSQTQQKSNAGGFTCEEGVGKMLKSPGCRRAVVSEFMDGQRITCSTLPNSELCDMCGELDPMVKQAIITSELIKTSGTPPNHTVHHSSPVLPTPMSSQTFRPRSPPVASPTALFNGKTAQISYKTRQEHAQAVKDLLSKLSGCFACRIVDPSHRPCHDSCANSGASSCTVSHHLPFSCRGLPQNTAWIDFRKAFPWPKDGWRCYFCGLPGSAVTDEHKLKVPNGNKCRYCDSAHAAAWYVLTTPHLLQGVGRDLGFAPDPNVDVERSFSQWLASYGSEKEDLRLLSVFQWLCAQFYH